MEINMSIDELSENMLATIFMRSNDNEIVETLAECSKFRISNRIGIKTTIVREEDQKARREIKVIDPVKNNTGLEMLLSAIR